MRGVPRPSVLVASAVVLVVAAWALAPGWFADGDPLDGDVAQRLLAPGTEHWFGTDELGRDLFTRVVHGAGASVGSASVAVLVALAVGATVGLVAGRSPGLVDDLLMRTADVLLAVPSLLLILVVVLSLGFGPVQVAVAIGLVASPAFARIMRNEVRRVQGRAFVDSARISGVGEVRVMVGHVLPNAVGPVAAVATLELGNAVLAVATLTFLGFGAAPPAPEWGQLIAGGQDHLATAWWLTTLPGLVVVAAVASVNHLGHLLRERAR